MKLIKSNKRETEVKTKPVRIELDIWDLLEKEAVKRTTQSEKIVQVSTVANDILKNYFEKKENGNASARSKKGQTVN